jgi:hypothetical protein
MRSISCKTGNLANSAGNIFFGWNGQEAEFLKKRKNEDRRDEIPSRLNYLGYEIE